MELQTESVRVSLAPDGFYPQAVRWHGRTFRVLEVFQVYTVGHERRYRVRTAEGPYELAVLTGIGAWHVRHSPSWLERARAHLDHMPRYPLPSWRRRSRSAIRAARVQAASVTGGGEYASRLALVQR